MGAPAPEQVRRGGRARTPPGRLRETRWARSELGPGTCSLGKVALRFSLPGLSLLICKTGFSVSCLLSSCYAMHSAVPPQTCLHFSISWGSLKISKPRPRPRPTESVSGGKVQFWKLCNVRTSLGAAGLAFMCITSRRYRRNSRDKVCDQNRRTEWEVKSLTRGSGLVSS